MSSRPMLIAACLMVLTLLAGCGLVTPTPDPGLALSATEPPQPKSLVMSPTPTVPQPTQTPAPPTSTPLPITPTEPPVPTEAPIPLDGRGGGIIAFYSERDGDAEIYLMNADGSAQTPLTDNDAHDTSPAWSPDGARLAFASDRHDPNPVRCFPDCNDEIYVMDATGENEQRLTDSPGADFHPAWSPDGARIAFVSNRDGNQEIYVMDADGDNLRQLTDDPADDMHPSWSPDGARILFNSMRDGNWELYALEVDAERAAPLRLTDSEDWELFGAYSPDGTRIAYFGCDPQCRPNRQDLYVMDVDGGNEQRLTDTLSVVDEDPVWSPDGARLAFQSDRNGNFEIYVMDAAGGNQQRLTSRPGGDYWPAWRPQPSSAAAAGATLLPSGQVFTRTGTFQIGLGDLDGDGDLDAVFANPMQHDSEVWLNDGGTQGGTPGHFTDTGQRLTRYGHGVGVADFDGDGDLDAFINCHQFVAPSRIYLNDGTGQMVDSDQDLGDAKISAAELNLLDLNGDGAVDVHVMYYDPNGLPDKVYLNDGAGVFRDSGLALDEEVTAWGDLDGDGDVDLFGKRLRTGYVVRFNDGRGGLDETWQMDDADSSLGGVALGDLDGDGDLDALVANGFRSTGRYPGLVLWNDGAGRFEDSGQRLNETLAADLALGDLDGDGDLDAFVANMDLPDEVWLNDGTGLFTDSGLRLGDRSNMSSKPSLGDLDGDGDLDVFVGSLGSLPQIWFNQTN